VKPNFASLTLMFPMWNEEELIRTTVAASQEAADSLVLAGEIGSYEILIVDDASTDATPQIADELAASDHHVRVVHHPVNRKLGGTLKTGSPKRGANSCSTPTQTCRSTSPRSRRRCVCCASTTRTS